MKLPFFDTLPGFIMDAGVTLINNKNLLNRRSGAYSFFKEFYQLSQNFTRDELNTLSKVRSDEFKSYVTENSRFYRENLDILTGKKALLKADLINNLDSILTIDRKLGYVSYTGGTTGASMEVYYTKQDLQERVALVESFRELHGWNVKSKTAWFSGKSFLNKRDIKSNIFWRDDHIQNIRFFSTLHVKDEHLKSIWDALCDFLPEFIVGFPTSIMQLCKFALEHNLTFPKEISVFFSTAETVYPYQRRVVEQVFGARVRDQYSSSEGAPFAFECQKGVMHFNPLTGSVRNSDAEQRSLVTSYTTHATPLINYDIGDYLDINYTEKCTCGSNFPIVSSLVGRSNAVLFGSNGVEVNQGNLSNCTKGVKGIIAFQAIQVSKTHIKILISNTENFRPIDRRKFEYELRLRFGDTVKLELIENANFVKSKSGKIKFIINEV